MAAVTSISGGFRMADGAGVVGRQGDVFEMRVSVPTDEDGFFGRQCPGCSQVFWVDYEALPEDLRLWCGSRPGLRTAAL